MRQIKFRAWNVITKVMIDLKKITPFAVTMDGDGLFIPFSNELILMQFTGLFDKNGKAIYDGDVMALDFGLAFNDAFVKWDDFNARFVLVGKDWKHEMNYAANNYMVVGNIYENIK